ncbi:ribosome biogenesis GTPase Der [Candidatus Neptunochlamydia vexilliferae]|uniref:GTPase Der n=1 Tax=Candidatus Neptunichlamydia vexilliferae TaxID=1651774 RepID=A0ABS0AZM0_9BACT|nr:ribosome biogenesis GTPase Der [Candidatus Neptunochlamydia vexilliferae]MBF5059591.1 GTPase Der [Candidatus Neptunochlamydia vexilliferae]
MLKIALIGRPNVGKSALFNRIAKRRIAIVDEMEGVTRDRLYAEAELFGRSFEIIDTGGIDEGSEIPFAEEVKMQAEIAIEEADSLIMVVDSRVGLTALDEHVAHLLLRSGKPLVLAVNKVDNEDESVLAPFYALGVEQVLPVSAIQGNNIAEMLELALDPCPEVEKEEEAKGTKVAIIGRPNVGKSTLINTLLDEARCVVSPIAGTTRDSIDVSVEWNEETFTFIDTAGIRRKKSEPEVVDKFAAIRTDRAIERADVCILMLDSQEGMTSQEKRILNRIEEKGKGCILFFNKWDLVKGFRMEHCKKGIEMEASFASYCPTLFGSAKTGRKLDDLFPLIGEVSHYRAMRISTGQLNKFIEGAIHKVHPPMIKGKRLRIYYMAQVDSNPPRFVFFVNHPDLLDDAYKRYLINQFREAYRYTGVPLTFYLKGKKARKGKAQEEVAFLESVSELEFI